MTQVGFIGIGAQKAATTWLHHVLSEHPSIVTSDEKELNFFTANYDRGYQWYEDQFQDRQGEVIRGECSPTYFFSRDAAERAARYHPGLRLICILRDPVERAFSNHMHEIRKGHIPADTLFEDAWARNPAYALQSSYQANLEGWLAHFKKDALLVLFSEDVASNPYAIYEQVCDHLGVAPELRPASITERHHENITYKNPAVQKTLRYGGDAMRSLGMQDLVKNLKQAPGVKQALSMNKQHLKTQVAPMRAETREMLIEHFSPDIEYVARITGRAVLPWASWRDLYSVETARNG